MKNINSHPPTDKHNQPQSGVAHEEDVDVVPCYLHHKNTKSQSLLWQQSLAEWLKSQRYCLTKNHNQAVLSEALLNKKACGFLTRLKAFGQ